ncbi:hypothetical protein N7468_002056 [Penicillium chermesinum]|uniref:Uncharacterized protein n=1 Tax=Penicillium chermesinum TaxID=63820 RepID=A0A9W9TY00_9EURO|nr:uncharacterized protein N7468_002056 [Penicillium chermesinum]KAJ5247073.1 hypothetical protein N7468_002056 [Penicillium chermesinum]
MPARFDVALGRSVAGQLRGSRLRHLDPRSQSLLSNLQRRGFATRVEHTTAINTSDESRERVIILGSGWGGYTLSRCLDPKQFSPLVISPRSYFVFTPLLTDAASGSLDFSNLVEPVRDPRAKVDFFQARARGLDLKKKTVLCEATVVQSGVTQTPRTEDNEGHPANLAKWEQGELFEVPYDKLVIAVGTVARTFNTPGVRDNALFFKDIGDAKRVKRRIRELFELAVLPTTTPEMKKWLLHFAIVGAGPTGTELAASLRDFIHKDLMRVYPALRDIPKISLYDVAPNVLSMFDKTLSQYAMDTMKSEGIDIKTSHHIKSLRWGPPGAPPPYHMDPKGCLTLETAEEGEVGVGMCVWVTGNAQNKFVKDTLSKIGPLPTGFEGDGAPDQPQAPEKSSWEFKKAKNGALLVDGHLRVQLKDETGRRLCLGDNAVLETGSPPATAQATHQMAKWLGKRLNKRDLGQTAPFKFRDLGTMAYIGEEKALMQIPHNGDGKKRLKYLPEGLRGRLASWIWDGAYITMSISWRNKLRVAFRWTLNRMFGRDVSRF